MCVCVCVCVGYPASEGGGGGEAEHDRGEGGAGPEAQQSGGPGGHPLPAAAAQGLLGQHADDLHELPQVRRHKPLLGPAGTDPLIQWLLSSFNID